VFKCVLYYCHRVASQLQLTHISSYHIISHHIISYHIIYHIIYIISYIISYHISYHISYRVISYYIIYHIISYQTCNKSKFFPCPHHEGHTRGVEVKLHSFVTSVLIGDEWFNSRPSLYPPVQNLDTHWIGGCVGRRGGVEFCKWGMYLVFTGIRTTEPPARILFSILTAFPGTLSNKQT
jgi:hypothetical protein